MKRAIILILALGAIVAPGSAGAAAQPDRSFGDGGSVLTPITGSAVVAYDVAVIRKRIVVVGQTSPPSGNGQVVVARYQPNGDLDDSFAGDGIFVSDLPAADGPFIATAVAPTASGDLLVAGGYGQGSMMAMMLTDSGGLAGSFGSGGIATVEAGGIAESVAIMANGSIYLGGSNANENGRPMVVSRLGDDGHLDGAFGRGGSAQISFWDPNLAASAGVAGLSTTRKGVLTGFGHIDYIGGDGHGSAGVFRLSPNGNPVGGFGDGGTTEIAFANPGGGFGQWFPCGFGTDSKRRITVTGDGEIGADAGILSARLAPSGELDRGYGTGGRSFIPAAGAGDSQTTCGATVAPNGTTTMGVGPVLARLTPGGNAAGRFGPGGTVDVTSPSGVGINAVAPAGRKGKRLVVAGFAGEDLYVARYRVPATR
jgi:uncharacterized delta-60 repeat protein